MLSDLDSKTLLITGASRGIGREIALKAASLGANVVIAAKSDESHPKLPGTIHSVAEEARALGAKALPVKLDVRDDASIAHALEMTQSQFGSLDALINNAGAIRLESAETLEMKRFDLLYQINTRAVLAVSKAALPLLKQASNPHILSLSPPLNLHPEWLGKYIPYTITKYGMTLLSLGLAEEFRPYGIGVNSLWPRTTISTAAVKFEVGEDLLARSRRPDIVADAACIILRSPASHYTGRALIDEDLLREAGETDFEKYRAGSHGTDLALDLYVNE